MKRNASTIVMLFALLAGCWMPPVDAHAQQNLKYQAAIPFSFSFNNRHFSAGDYQYYFPRGPFMLALYNLNTRQTTYLDVRPEISSSRPSRAGLIFRYDGEHYSLTAIKFSGTDSYTVPVRIAPPTENTMVARAPAGSRLDASR